MPNNRELRPRADDALFNCPPVSCPDSIIVDEEMPVSIRTAAPYVRSTGMFTAQEPEKPH